MSEPRYHAPEVAAAAGAPFRQLDYWARTGLVTPSIREANGSGTRRLYSEEDLERVRVIMLLLHAGFSLPAVRRFMGSDKAHINDALKALRTARANLEYLSHPERFEGAVS